MFAGGSGRSEDDPHQNVKEQSLMRFDAIAPACVLSTVGADATMAVRLAYLAEHVWSCICKVCRGG